MFANIIAQKTGSTITGYLTGKVYPLCNIQIVKPQIWDTVRNIITGEVGVLYNFCDDPYSLSDHPKQVAYVICEHPDGGTYSDHWQLNTITVI